MHDRSVTPTRFLLVARCRSRAEVATQLQRQGPSDDHLSHSGCKSSELTLAESVSMSVIPGRALARTRNPSCRRVARKNGFRVRSLHSSPGMTTVHFGQATSFPRRDLRPSCCHLFAPSKSEGAGKAGRVTHPQPRVQNEKARKQSHHRFAETIRPSLRDGFTVCFVLSLVIGLSCHHRRRIASTNLTPASRRQDHTTSPSANRAARRATQSVAIASRAPRS